MALCHSSVSYDAYEGIWIMADYLDREHEELYWGLIRNCTIGLGIVLQSSDSGRGHILINPTPIDCTNDSQELRTFMRMIALSWLDQLETIPFKNVVNDNESNT